MKKKKQGLLGRLFSIYLKEPEAEKPKVPDRKRVQQAPDPMALEYHKVAGVSYRQEALQALGTRNPEFYLPDRKLARTRGGDRTVWEYTFKVLPAILVPEPENPYDPKAIKVLVGGQHIGYIKKGSCGHVNKLMREDRIAKVTCKLTGGRCKDLTRWSPDEPYDIELNAEGTIGARLTIELKPIK